MALATTGGQSSQPRRFTLENFPNRGPDSDSLNTPPSEIMQNLRAILDGAPLQHRDGSTVREAVQAHEGDSRERIERSSLLEGRMHPSHYPSDLKASIQEHNQEIFDSYVSVLSKDGKAADKLKKELLNPSFKTKVANFFRETNELERKVVLLNMALASIGTNKQMDDSKLVSNETNDGNESDLDSAASELSQGDTKPILNDDTPPKNYRGLKPLPPKPKSIQD